MNVEQLYMDTVQNLRAFTNSFNRKDAVENHSISNHLMLIKNRINFLMVKDPHCEMLERELYLELAKFSKKVFKKISNREIYIKKLQKNIELIKWINKHQKINSEPRRFTVAQKEIFYAYLGNNIGSEQNGRRPVIILQNNTGNRKGNTTIVAPITTHRKQVRWDHERRKFYYEIIKDGHTINKYLDFYEIPLRLEDATGLYGFVNIAHIREIDRKRINGPCVGIATDECYIEIYKAIKKNLELSI